jgi:hypothetical protein
VHSPLEASAALPWKVTSEPRQPPRSNPIAPVQARRPPRFKRWKTPDWLRIVAASPDTATNSRTKVQSQDFGFVAQQKSATFFYESNLQQIPFSIERQIFANPSFPPSSAYHYGIATPKNPASSEDVAVSTGALARWRFTESVYAPIWKCHRATSVGISMWWDRGSG